MVNPSDERGELQVEETPAPPRRGTRLPRPRLRRPELEVSPRLQPLLKKVRTYNPKADLRSLEQAFEVAARIMQEVSGDSLFVQPDLFAPEIEVEGLIYNGVQKIPGMQDQYVFTETETKSTFYTTDISEAHLKAERDRVRAKFKEAGTGALKGVPSEPLSETNTRFYSIDDAALPLPLQDGIVALTSPDMAHMAASDKGFVSWLHKKAGILHIPNKDLGLLEQYLSLPYYLSKKYPVFRNLLNTQINREERRSDGLQQFLKAAQTFLTSRVRK